jgi:hypothetical protein
MPIRSCDINISTCFGFSRCTVFVPLCQLKSILFSYWCFEVGEYCFWRQTTSFLYGHVTLYMLVCFSLLAVFQLSGHRLLLRAHWRAPAQFWTLQGRQTTDGWKFNVLFLIGEPQVFCESTKAPIWSFDKCGDPAIGPRESSASSFWSSRGDLHIFGALLTSLILASECTKFLYIHGNCILC